MPLLDVLLPKTKQALLAALLTQPDRAWYLSELARFLSVAPSSLQRELAQFVEGGIVTRRADGNRVYYQADRTCPIFAELAAILNKTAGLAGVLRGALKPLRPKIGLAFVYGSIAAARERSASDVDLMVIGKANLAELAPVLRSAERRLQRPVNATVYTTAGFQKRLTEKNHFLTTVLGTELLFVYGTSDDLERIANDATRTAP